MIAQFQIPEYIESDTTSVRSIYSKQSNYFANKLFDGKVFKISTFSSAQTSPQAKSRPIKD